MIPSQIHIMNHPLIQHKLAVLRCKDTNVRDFRLVLKELALLIAYEATRNMETRPIEIETPLMKTTCRVVKTDVCLVPILRAGLGLVDALLDLMPYARVGHIGLYRDPDTHMPVEYYFKTPGNLDRYSVFVLDPMLATGGSAVAAVDALKKRGAKDIKMINIIGAPEGVKCFSEAHPDVNVYLGALDERLNEKCYILPGLGDAGDRIFGTL